MTAFIFSTLLIYNVFIDMARTSPFWSFLELSRMVSEQNLQNNFGRLSALAR